MAKSIIETMVARINAEVEEWYAKQGCLAAQCPKGCQHPQPIIAYGQYICGRCYHVNGIVTDMVPWHPGID